MVTFVAAKQSVFKLADTGGTVRNLTAYLTAIEGLPGDRDLSDVTALGDEGEGFIPGMEISTFSLEGTFDPAATTGPDAVLGPLLDHGAVVAFQYGPRGAAVGAVRYTGNCWLYRYTLGVRTGGVVPFVADFLVNGTVTRDTWPGPIDKPIAGTVNDGRVYFAGGQGYFFNDSVDVGIGSGGTQIHSFLRFTNVTIPQGALVTAASLTVTSISGNMAGTILTKVYANDEDNAIAPTTYAEYMAKSLTAAAVDWDGPPWATDVEYTSPDISAVIQEIIDRPGWVSGNALMVMWKNDGSVYSYPGTRWQAYDVSDAQPAKVAELHIEYL